MSAAEDHIADDMLMAYADGLLDEAETARVGQWLEAHPDKAAEVALWRRQNEAIGALYPPVPREPLPVRLDQRRLAERSRRGVWPMARVAAAATLLVAISGGAGWLGRDLLGWRPSASDVLIADAISAHGLYTNEKRHAVEVVANEQEHLVAWLSNRIDRKIDAPDLSAEGFALVGGRLLPPNAELEAGPAAQLMYENADAGRVTVYITAGLNPMGRAYQFANYDGHDAVYWANDMITCTVVGDMARADLEVVARQIYKQLSWPPGGGPAGATETW